VVVRPTTGMAMVRRGAPLEPWTFERRDLRPDDVAVEVLWCGVCASDVAALQGVDEARLPLVVGHEFTGRVREVGDSVTWFAAGDLVAVGNVVDSCGVCEECRAGFENYCRVGPTPTYLGTDRRDGLPTQGAWSGEHVVRDRFAHALPAALDPAAAAPLMCAGITVWEALQHWSVGPGRSVGVVGLGGLGHLAVRFARALGARVTVFTTSAGKREAALALGADEVVVSSESDQMRAQGRRLDFVLDTAGGEHDPSPYLETLRLHGAMCMVGIQPRIDLASASLRRGRRSLSGSGTGSPRSTREMLDFASTHGIVADVEVLPVRRAQEAVDRLSRGDVRGRLVLDLRGGVSGPA